MKAPALPFLRINLVFSIGMLVFFMLSTALRAAGDARTPLRLGVAMTVLPLLHLDKMAMIAICRAST